MHIKINIINILVACTFLIAKRCKCEPPASSYGAPPRNGPSPSYGPPTAGSKPFGGNGGGGGGQSPNFDVPAGRPGQPSPSYGPPNGIQPPSSGSANGYDSNANAADGGAEPEPFSFSYEVKDAATGNDYSHRQESDGKTVKGEYQVLLPDGRNQVVTYTADDGGYNAKVQYDGEASSSGGGAGGGYPSGGPTGSGSGYPSGRPASGSGYPSGGLTSSSGGYPSGGPSSSSGGYPSGGPANNGGGFPSGGTGGSGSGSGGYPSGGPGAFPTSGSGGGSSTGYPRGPSGSSGTPQSSYLPPSSSRYRK